MTAGPGALGIPADALDAVCDASSGVFRPDLDTALRDTAAPLIVAAELRRLADRIDVVADPAGDGFQHGETAGRRQVWRRLLARADWLDPAGNDDCLAHAEHRAQPQHARYRACPWCESHPQPWRCGHREEAPPPDSQ